MESTLVIKVKHGQTLRRFSAYLLPGNDIFDLDMDGLREKICSLFSFPSDADLKMTYIDEDGDEVTLVDDKDVYDATDQRLNSLRINVRLRDEKSRKTCVPFASPMPSTGAEASTQNVHSASPMPPVTSSKSSKETTPCFAGGFSGNDAGFTRMSDTDQEYLNECPYCGVPLPGDFPFRSKRSFTRYADLGTDMFHDVICEGCGVYPITGPRFTSKVKEEFDLCGMCFAKIGNEVDYFRLDDPFHHRHSRSFWGLQNQVDDSLDMTLLVSPILQDLDWNLPQVSSLVNGCNPVKPADELRKSESEMYFPDQELTVPAAPESSSAAAYPAHVDKKFPVSASLIPPLTHPITDVSMPAPAIATPPPTEGSIGNKELEERLLKELKKMGFSQVDLNKKVLRINEYNLEQTVDDLCGVSKWDPILEELEEMGFHDQVMNKKLLVKNNGSIKHVVMDLISEEKA